VDIRFIVNLRKDTTDEKFVRALMPRGWLASPNNVSQTLASRLAEVRIGSRWFVADNGNFALIGQVAETLQDEVDALTAEVDGHSVNLADVPSLRTDALAGIFGEVATRSAAAQSALAPSDLLQSQTALGATHLIGAEDVAPAVFLRLGLQPEWFREVRADVKKRNRRVATKANRLRETLPSSLAERYYPVASAIDHNTAFDAGRLFASRGLDRIAMGFGAYMADDTYAYGFKIGRRWVPLDRRLPNRYLRTALVVEGFFNGYQKEVGSTPTGFHFLGLGAPIMMAVAARAAWGTAELTFDAMSPILDAAQGTIYTNRPAYLKVRTRKIAASLASGDRESWNCPCPFCQDFMDHYPFDYSAIQTAAVRLGRSFSAEDFRPNGALYEAASLLAEPKAGARRQAANAARMGHNHWVLSGVCRQLRSAAKTLQAFDRRLDRIVDSYYASTTTTFGDAVRLATSISRGEYS
jgi:hypothetical protein